RKRMPPKSSSIFPVSTSPLKVSTVPACAARLPRIRKRTNASRRIDRLPLVKRDVMPRHGQDRGVRRGAIDRPDVAFPRALVVIVVHTAEEGVFHEAVPAFPDGAADHVLRGGGVIAAVGPPLHAGMVFFEEIVGASLHERVVVLAADLERIDGRRGARE